MATKYKIFLDARTKDCCHRVSSFSEDLESCMRDYEDWIDELHLRREDIWYADIFDIRSLKLLYRLQIEDDGIVAIVAPDNLRIHPFRRRRTIKQVLAVKTGQLAEKLERVVWDTDK